VRKIFLSLGVGLLLSVTPSLTAAFGSEADVTPLSNKDVLVMVQDHQSEETIINAIKSSSCTFDTFPPVLRELKRKGVSDAVLQAMIDAPYGISQQAAIARDQAGDQPIYHYADQLKQMGYISPTQVGQPARFERQSVRGSRNQRTSRRE
jgi:hypothetical protein